MIAVILCGGVGSRLWPASRDLYPKPFLKLPDGENFIQKTFRRAAQLPEVERLVTVTNKEISFKIQEDLTDTGITLDASYILEPFGRNTAPAIAIAVINTLRQHNPDEVMIVLPSDHLIQKDEEFKRMVAAAIELARSGRLVTFGIRPSKPDTGFGYIEADGNTVVRFVEKPDLDTARDYVESGRFLWNSGMFCFQAGTMLAEMERYCPEIVALANACLDASPVKDACIGLDKDIFAKMPATSIDFAVMEHSKQVAVVSCDIGWNDVGSWNELCALDPVDEHNNHVVDSDNLVVLDSQNCNVSNKTKLVALLGVKDLLIIDTDDALLIADRTRDQDVRHVYNELKKRGHETHKQHRTIHRPWGNFSVLEHGTRFKIKKLVLKPGAAISLQLHHHRSEHWVVVSGMAEVECDDQVFFVRTNESTFIKPGFKHRVVNPGKIELVIIEVQSGDYLGEDDIERFEDMYGRE